MVLLLAKQKISMPKQTMQNLKTQVKTLQSSLERQKKISNALLNRVKKNLKYHLNPHETFEHNSILLNQIKETKKELYNSIEAAQKNSYLARHDTLTGLYNRNVFNKKLNSVVNKTGSHALFFLDLDQFKVVNDTAGHLAGDEMIKQIAEILLNTIESQGTLARLGGDEFGYIMEDCSKVQAKNKAKQFLSLIDKFHFRWDKKLFTVSVSVGLVIIDPKTNNSVDAFKNADIACYIAKNAGRNQYHIYTKGLSDDLSKHNKELKWLPKITKALESNQFELYVQPIKRVNPLADHCNYEILIRLNDGNNIINPETFLPPAERYNLITKIDCWVIQHAFNWLSNNIKNFDPQVRFSINISGHSLGKENVLNLIIKSFETSVITGKNICFEVTETTAISNFSSANQFIRKLKKYGCLFSLDDFGSGLSSLSYLKNMNFDILKVDGSFIRDLLDDPLNEEMVKSINNIGHIMGMKTIAEYVESQGVYDKLVDLGFDGLQGFYIGKPVPIDNLININP